MLCSRLRLTSVNLKRLGSELHRFGQCRHFVAPTHFLLEKMTMKVPAMGDSITEGTIVEWTVDVGQAVKEGDVVALVETDKVTVDIKAEVDGVITAHYGSIDDTIEVGADLYQIDTEASSEQVASGVSSEQAASADTPKEGDDSSSSSSEESSSSSSSEDSSSDDAKRKTRTPSIQFLGKEGWAARRSPSQTEATTSDDPSPATYQPLEAPEIDPMYGRPSFSEEEMEAFILGGANVAPDNY